MDIVITYVDGLDPLWQKDYSAATGKPVLAKRFRDWGTLKYLLRGIENNMPFVENVFLVVSRDSQVPSWVNRDRVRVVLHEEIIPSQFLPTFNSTAIEMFLHMIPGLGEEFIYFNDDIFPVRKCSREQFYQDGKAVAKPSLDIFAVGLYKKQCRNASNLARKAAGLAPVFYFARAQHSCSPMLRTANETVFAAIRSDVMDSISPLREEKNINQHLFTDYLYWTSQLVRKRMSCKHMSLAVVSAAEVAAFIDEPTKDFVCINDVTMSDEKYEKSRSLILAAFQRRFPEKSAFEL